MRVPVQKWGNSSCPANPSRSPKMLASAKVGGRCVHLEGAVDRDKPVAPRRASSRGSASARLRKRFNLHVRTWEGTLRSAVRPGSAASLCTGGGVIIVLLRSPRRQSIEASWPPTRARVVPVGVQPQGWPGPCFCPITSPSRDTPFEVTVPKGATGGRGRSGRPGEEPGLASRHAKFVDRLPECGRSAGILAWYGAR